MQKPSGGSPFPGFDGLRFFAALAVICSHAFVIAIDNEKPDSFDRLLGRTGILGVIGDYGVYTFFIISGFLLARSLSQGGDIVQFIVNRLLRIYPGFFFCILITALIVGPLVSSSSSFGYFSNSELYSYIVTEMTCMCGKATLPGVYAYEGDVATVVNGSLWSLSYEVLTYVFLLWLWIVIRSTRGVAIAIAVVAIATTTLPQAERSLPGIAYMLPYFAGGVVMHSVHERFGTHGVGAFLCVAGLAVAAFYGLQKIAFAILGAYLIVYLAGMPNIGSKLAARFGDMSYGMYLFGWPMEQVAKQFSGTSSPALLMTLALPLILLFAAISCHAIEQPALSLKKRITLKVRAIEQRVLRTGQRSRAFTLGATLCSAVAVPLLLLSKVEWWYVTERVAELIALAIVGGIVAAAFVRVKNVYRP